jgi:hypothetical protein
MFCTPLRLEPISPAAAFKLDLFIQWPVTKFEIEEHAIVGHGCFGGDRARAVG